MEEGLGGSAPAAPHRQDRMPFNGAGHTRMTLGHRAQEQTHTSEPHHCEMEGTAGRQRPVGTDGEGICHFPSVLLKRWLQKALSAGRGAAARGGGGSEGAAEAACLSPGAPRAQRAALRGGAAPCHPRRRAGVQSPRASTEAGSRAARPLAQASAAPRPATWQSAHTCCCGRRLRPLGPWCQLPRLRVSPPRVSSHGSGCRPRLFASQSSWRSRNLRFFFFSILGIRHTGSAASVIFMSLLL